MVKVWMMVLSLIVALALCACGMVVEEHEYAEYFAAESKKLQEISRNGVEDSRNQDYINEALLFYHVQTDGHGLAFTMHPDGMDASGTTYMVVYETADGRERWDVLHECFRVDRGRNAVVYMGEVVVLAADCSKGTGGSLVISYDRGHTWSEKMHLHELMDYDISRYSNIEPYVINYNEHTGIITFGWKGGYDYGSEYLLINQFDASSCEFVEEVFRSPDFPKIQ